MQWWSGGPSSEGNRGGNMLSCNPKARASTRPFETCTARLTPPPGNPRPHGSRPPDRSIDFDDLIDDAMNAAKAEALKSFIVRSIRHHVAHAQKMTNGKP